MLSFVLTALILHACAWCLYLVLRRGMSLKGRRRTLHLTLLAAVTFPLMLPYEAPVHVKGKPAMFGTVTHQELVNFCACEEPNLSHRILYQTYSVGIFLSKGMPFWMGLSLLLALWWSIRLVKDLNELRRIARFNRGARSVDSSWSIFHSDCIPSGAFWWGRGVIILGPETHLLSEAEQQAVIRHESAHLRHQDPFELLCMRILLVLWFWNPILWLMLRELRWISECRADDDASMELGRKTYGRLLLALQSGSSPSTTLAPGIKSQMYRRIKRLATAPYASSPGPVSPILKASLILALQFVVLGPVEAGVASTLTEWSIHQQASELDHPEEVLFCPDCESVCYPEPGDYRMEY